MRKQTKLLANFLGAAKELTAEYVELAGITDQELDQIRLGMVERASRKETVRLLHSKGIAGPQIAEISGWSLRTVRRELAELECQVAPERVPNGTRGREAARAEIAAAAAAEGTTPAPEGKYRIIYADPPWSYGNTMPDHFGEQRDHYAVMALADICAIPVKNWVEDNAVLFLWVTAPIAEEAFDVVRAWGFEYKAKFVWDKIKHVMGHYNSVRHEELYICTRGACQPDKQQLFDSVQSIERSKNHSEKPVEFYDIIETIYTHGRKLEMFGRRKRDGWDVYGHVAEIGSAMVITPSAVSSSPAREPGDSSMRPTPAG
jgi:N6-adenosine-specific RNA methylase IME4